MRKSYGCECCGLGLAFGGFKNAQTVWNFRTYRLGAASLETQDDGSVKMSRQELPRFIGSPNILDATTCTIPEFSYLVNEIARTVEVTLKLQASRGAVAFGPSWSWELFYRVPLSSWELLIQDGRLGLNPFLVSATHSGSTEGNFPSTSQGIDGGSSFSATLNSQADLGNVVLAWPPFFEDWTNKKLTVLASTATPTVLTATLSDNILDVTGFMRPFEFVFDESTATLPADTERQIFVDRVEENYATECWSFMQASHQRHVSGEVLQVSFVGGRDCTNLGAGNQYNTFAPACIWRISGIWWQAFQSGNSVEVEVDDTLAPNVSPVLCIRTQAGVFRVLSTLQRDVYPFSLSLTLSPISP